MSEQIAVATTTSVTPYAAANIVNAAFLAAGVDKVIPAQMIYNYTSARVRKNLKPLGGLVMEGSKITTKSLEAWIKAQIVKRTAS